MKDGISFGILSQCVCHLFIAVTKRLDKNNLEDKKCILAQSFTSSVRGHPTLLLWGQGKAEHRGGRAWQRENVQLMTARKHRELENKEPGII